MKVNSHDTNSMQHALSNNSKTHKIKRIHGEGTLNSELKKLANDVYHKEASETTSPTYPKPLVMESREIDLSKSVDEAMYELAVATGELYMPGGSVPKAVEKMLSPYDSMMSDIIKEQPSLEHQNWGIAINRSGELEAIGSISDDEKAFLDEKLNSNKELVAAVNEFKSSYLEFIGAEYRGYGQYEVDESNFSEVFDFRQMLESSRSDEAFKKTWNYETNWLKLNDNLLSQLESNAPKHKD